jgi:hypothetical protein
MGTKTQSGCGGEEEIPTLNRRLVTSHFHYQTLSYSVLVLNYQNKYYSNDISGWLKDCEAMYPVLLLLEEGMLRRVQAPTYDSSATKC